MRTRCKQSRQIPLTMLICLSLLLCGCGRSVPAPVVFGGSDGKPEKAAPKPMKGKKSLASRSQASPGAIIQQGVVTIGDGDTVYIIAQRHRVAVRDLINHNRLSPPYRLRGGQTLIIPRMQIHPVVAGDTLYAISRSHRIDMYTVAAVNRIEPPYTIRIGQRLRIPDRTKAHALKFSRSGSAPAVSSASPLPTATVTKNRGTIASSARFLWPLRGRVISRFGPKAGGLHNDGINIAASEGTPVVAADNGVVAYAGNELRGFGNLLLVRHAGGWTTAYAHTHKLLVKRGDRVKKGDVIARVGTTGRVSRPQLHFELRRGSDAVDPLRFLAKLSGRG